MKNIAAIYNICELKNKNTEMYCSHINSILQQDYPESNYKVVVSGCGVTNHTKNILKETFKNNVYFIFYDDPYKCVTTFNKTVDVLNKKSQSFDEYMYIASDVNMTDKNCFKKVNEHSSDECGIIQFQVDKDCGLRSVNEELFNNPYVGQRYYKLESPYFKSDTQIKVGHSANLHCLSFTSNIHNFFEKILPDVFYWCPEPVLAYMASSLKYKHILAGNILLNHMHEQDGTLANGDPHKLIDPKFTDLTINDMLNENAKSFGFGFKEFQHKENCRNNIVDDKYMMHDESQYDENGFCKNEQLKFFIKDNLFSKKYKFDYETIKYEFFG